MPDPISCSDFSGHVGNSSKSARAEAYRFVDGPDLNTLAALISPRGRFVPYLSSAAQVQLRWTDMNITSSRGLINMPTKDLDPKFAVIILLTNLVGDKQFVLGISRDHHAAQLAAAWGRSNNTGR